MNTKFSGSQDRLASFLTNPLAFTSRAAGLTLRPYQEALFPCLLESIRAHSGDTFTMVFPRQSGKDELLLHLQAYLLYVFASQNVGIVVVNPTYRPQTLKALQRFDDLLDHNRLTRGRWRVNGPFTRLLGRARISFLSGDSNSNVVGDTASLLLIVNEAQDILPGRYYTKFLPMTASTNASRLLAGTVWTSDSLLSRQMRLARRDEQRDGRQRVFLVDADQVSQVLPSYAEHVRQVVASHGRQHPFIKTQYFNEELDSSSALFNPARLSLIHAIPFKEGGAVPLSSDSQEDTPSGRRGVAAFLLDVAGQDENLISVSSSLALDNDLPLANASRDSVALTVVQVDLSTLELLKAPTYRVVERHAWIGVNHLTVFGKLKALAERWAPLYFVVDATGVGEGLWAMLERSWSGKVHPVKYTSAVKSEIGYRFISVIESGRFRDTVPDPRVQAQYRACQAEILPGPAKTLRWGVPEGVRDSSGELIHDDHLMADSLVAVLDNMEWAVSSPTTILNLDLFDEDRFGASRYLPDFRSGSY
jgi:hypothetical protein